MDSGLRAKLAPRNDGQNVGSTDERVITNQVEQACDSDGANRRFTAAGAAKKRRRWESDALKRLRRVNVGGDPSRISVAIIAARLQQGPGGERGGLRRRASARDGTGPTGGPATASP